NGTVVVAGGSTNGAGLNFSTDPNCGLGLGTTAISRVEVFDPSTLTWAAAASMSQARNEFSLVRLVNGTLLAAGGADSTAAEIYDAATDTWSSAGGMHSSRVGAAYTLMPGGRVMVAGGNFGAIWPFCDSTAEVYDPSANTWTSTGSMALDRRNATATVVRMPNGTHRVLVAGGIDNRGSSIESSAELYDPATNTWTATGSMTTPRVGHTATLMTRTGLVLVTGGSDGTSVLSSAEVYDPSTGTWMALNPMATARSSHTATQLLIPGITKVAIVGGSDGTPGTAGLSSAELFQPTPLPSRTFLSASGPCQPITLTAFVSSTTGTGTPTGTVAFKDGATTLATVGLDASAEASLPLGMLPDGSHAFSASYSGDDSFDASLGTLAQVASTAPTVTIPGTFPARTLGTSVTLSASVSGGSAPYSYAWQRDGSSLTGGATLTDTPALGVNSYELTVTDASGCASVAALAQVDVFDFTVAVTPAEVTLLRGGLAQGVSAAVTLVNGSSTSGLPAAVVIGSGGAPADLTGLSGTVPLPHTAGATAVGALSLHPGPSSLGDFAASVTASVGAGTRSASLGLHLFDFGLSLAPSDVTGYRAGYPLGLLVTSTVTPGSTAQRPASFGLVASLPPDATYAVSPTLGLSSSAPLTIDPGPASSGTFPFTVTALSPLGSRSAAGTLHLLVDTTPPVIGVTVTGTVGTNGWYVSDATVSWTVSD
ncbi:MAG TPA: kelch repeat-containing protein, partial [Acidimicrobiales bacterium]|nr:kelch repeat-containing protein [Acidimicrobiales bacterium]